MLDSVTLRSDLRVHNPSNSVLSSYWAALKIRLENWSGNHRIVNVAEAKETGAQRTPLVFKSLDFDALVMGLG